MAIVRSRKVSLAPVLSISIPLALSLAWQPFVNGTQFPQVYASLAFSILAFVATLALIPRFSRAFVKIGLRGRDLLKKSEDDVPECMGLVAALVYICALVCFIPVPFSAAFISDPLTSRVNPEYAPHRQLAVYLAAILSVMIATILGLLDDLFDIRWRHKLPIPLVASVPLLLSYYAEQGNTHVVLPKPLAGWFGDFIDLGFFYYVYMAMLSTFTTNSINILAGINGVEVAQTIVISASIILNDLLFLPWPFTLKLGRIEISGFFGKALAQERHLFSLYFMMPLLAVSLGFAYHNKYPARAFPGDTLCYFSGMAFAVVAILGHFSKTLLLFFVPQAFNFILSAPQLFGLVPCPRHRLPKLRPDGYLDPSTAEIENPSGLTIFVLQVLNFFGLAKVKFSSDKRRGTTTNLTLLNFVLNKTGPIKESTLTNYVIVIQILSSAAGFAVRYGLAGLLYDGDRR
ncbi:related to ALG7-UDP-N-acetylglucosamine-1-phosphate transferase [Serendipita indica DSM 11827]|uniref:UDP-N-acetylglucosamine--dolichyl-phosphate N-acetylglucosaminephosphotransferase n=1 Tax=Serendipita indica (strain DSM 11827) TaxID=1109443 RepID=G4T929_SERID|nr:related to ALG7-UDP-N-acetylglucosamine-1-phosphate transferase [Serendipita indica DSM 11827]